ncbi:hypothetical protein B0T10DRAFT_581799 [Thelonectria olida]|uniref:Uncharacterized protein n=1 Tax=Thelonectria olida TaxID=1576542 RepID=A0A9P8VY57_9HYPO|nr:hypothetical protein B0T10DRAFT_581799 [Thelonectria olida]
MSEQLDLVRRDVTPAVCYDDCNGAYQIAKSKGKVPSLCEPSSTFQKAYNRCANCLKANADEDSDLRNLVDPQLGQFINYCGLDRATRTGIFTGTDGAVQTLIYLVPAANTASTTTVGDSTSSRPGTFSRPPTSTTRTSTSSPTTTTAFPIASSASGEANKAWIAGPVIGVIVGLLLTIAMAFLLGRRRRKLGHASEEGWMFAKAELHADSVPPKKPEEIDGQMICELPGSMPAPAEMSVAEVAANEMSSSSEIAHTDATSTASERSSMNHTQLTNEVSSTTEAPSTNGR